MEIREPPKRDRSVSSDAHPSDRGPGSSCVFRANACGSDPAREKDARRYDWLEKRPAHGGRRALNTANLLIVIISVGMIGLLGRVIQLQVYPSQQITRYIDSQRSRVPLHARRGSLLDRRGRVLASTRMAERLFVDPRLIEDPGTFAEQVGFALGYDPAWVEREISRREDRRYVPIDHRLSEDRVKVLEHLHLSGLGRQPRLVRDYPYGALAGQVIGFVGFDGKGLEGIEWTADNILSGSPGGLMYQRDAARNPLWVERSSYQPPTHGRSVRLSIDVTIQSYAQHELASSCRQYGAASGQMVMMDPGTGEILAMANYPPFDPSRFSQTQPRERRNRCVTDAFEPGSTFKPFVWAKATEHAFALPDEMIDCTEGGYYVSPKRRVLRDAHAHGEITWEQVLVRSSNIGMAIVGQRMGVNTLYAAVTSFGFGRVTGSGLPGESGGIINPLRKWNHYSETSVPMGQEVAVTALQLARGYCVIANGGLLVTPTILATQEGRDESHEGVPSYPRVLSEDVARVTRDVLRVVVTEGTGRKANSRYYDIFGKTGTAQVPDPQHGGYAAKRYMSSFVGMAPLQQPRLVVVCMIQSPDPEIGYYGGTVAGPGVKRVIERSLLYLGVAPNRLADDNPGTVQLAHGDLYIGR